MRIKRTLWERYRNDEEAVKLAGYSVIHLAAIPKRRGGCIARIWALVVGLSWVWRRCGRRYKSPILELFDHRDSITRLGDSKVPIKLVICPVVIAGSRILRATRIRSEVPRARRIESGERCGQVSGREQIVACDGHRGRSQRFCERPVYGGSRENNSGQSRRCQNN